MLKNILLGAVLPIALVAVGVGVMVVMKRPDPGKKPPIEDTPAALLGQMLAADVQTVRSLSELSETLDIPVSGTVVPFREIQLAAEASGRITDKDPNTRSGNLVKAGDVLYRIDPRDYELEVERLNRKLEQERASLNELQQDIENAKRLSEVADQEMKLAEAEVARFEQIKGGFRSEAELDQAKRSRLASMNQRVTIQNQVSILQARRSRSELGIKLVETELQQANLNLQRTVIRAPVTGRVVREQIEADSYVQRGTPLVTIEDTSSVEVACNIRMDQLYWILDQQDVSTDTLVNAAQASRYELPKNEVKVRYSLAGRESSTYEWSGVLARYDGAGIDPQSRTVPVRVLVPKPGEFTINGQPAEESSLSGPAALVRGMFVEVIIGAKPATPLFLVPKLSVKPSTGTNQIWKFTPDSKALDEIRESLKKAGTLATGATASMDSGQEEQSRILPTPDEWQAGFLIVVEGVSVIGPYRGKVEHGKEPIGSVAGISHVPEIEYWVCEVQNAALAAGDKVVITPLPGIEADGDEPIRVRKSQLQ